MGIVTSEGRRLRPTALHLWVLNKLLEPWDPFLGIPTRPSPSIIPGVSNRFKGESSAVRRRDNTTVGASH